MTLPAAETPAAPPAPKQPKPQPAPVEADITPPQAYVTATPKPSGIPVPGGGAYATGAVADASPKPASEPPDDHQQEPNEVSSAVAKRMIKFRSN
eukprot:scaffold166549_cov29-Prasinocladus_malaysianus.AAC.1